MRFSGLKKAGFILAAGCLAIFSSCGDEIDIPNVPLEGKVNGVDWASDKGNTTLDQGGQNAKYVYRLLSTNLNAPDPCAIVSTTTPHIRMILPLGTGSYTIPFPNFNETVKFDYGDGTVISATSGFVEILAVGVNQQVGYIQAVLDDENTVEGRFVVEIC